MFISKGRQWFSSLVAHQLALAGTTLAITVAHEVLSAGEGNPFTHFGDYLQSFSV